jgi:hypothetical protein
VGGTRFERWTPVSGIVYVTLFLIAFIVTSDSPQASDSDEKIVSFYADSGNRAQDIAALFLIVFAALFFLWFVSLLRDRLRTVESEPGRLSALGFGAGVASATLLMAAACVGVAPSVTASDTDRFVLDANLARLLTDMSYSFLVASTMTASLLVAAASVLALRTAVLPRWLGWVGLLVALVLLLAYFFFPLFALWVWVLVVSILLMMRFPPSSNPSGTSPIRVERI